MIEQEIASLAQFILNNANNSEPYYSEIPMDFIVPSVYFPPPEVDTYGETFRTFRLRYYWNVKFFHQTVEDAYALAMGVLVAFKKAKHLIPLINENGEPTGEYLRVNDPSIKKLDDGAYHIKLEWDSRRPYDNTESAYMQNIILNLWKNGNLYKQIPVSPQNN